MVVPARQAYSHSASVGSLQPGPTHRAKAMASFQFTLIAGLFTLLQPSSSGFCRPVASQKTSHWAKGASYLLILNPLMETSCWGPSLPSLSTSLLGLPMLKVPEGICSHSIVAPAFKIPISKETESATPIASDTTTVYCPGNRFILLESEPPPLNQT